MKAKELKLKNQAELEKLLSDNQAKLKELHFKLVGAQIKNFQEIQKIKKDIARILTILHDTNIRINANDTNK